VVILSLAIHAFNSNLREGTVTRRLTGDEIAPTEIDPAKVRVIAGALAQLLFGVSDLLALCHSSLGMPAEADLMSDEGVPPPLQVQLRGDIEILVNETLPAAIKILGEIASESEESLLAQWRQRSGSTG
jgi:hypothetical protein